jgi:hypothetical protein
LPFRPRSPIVSRVGLLLAAVLGLVALAGCGTETLDADKGESAIKGVIEEQTGADVSSVDCPDDVKVQKGKSFTCEVTGADGTKAKIDAVQTSDKGDIDIKTRLLSPSFMEEFIGESIRGMTGRRAIVDCPGLVVVKEAGTRLTCRSSSGGKKKNVAVKVDAQGRITWDLGG